MGPIFFLSYSSNPAHESNLKRFHEDLVREILAERDSLAPVGGAKLGPNAIGFYDRAGIQVGDTWPDELAEALRTCRVFLYMQSEGYFSRTWCSREWGVFRARVDDWVKANPGAKRPRLIIPVRWKPAEPPPLDALDRDIQNTDATFGPAYAEHGLRTLMKNKKFEDDYNDFLTALSRRILQAHDDYPLPEAAAGSVSFTKAPDAFSASAPGGGIAAGESRKGPRFVLFVYVVGKSGELKTFRHRLDCYGDDGWLDWRPFLPGAENQISWYANRAVLDDGSLEYDRIELGKNLIDDLRAAERANKIIILVVDSWSLHLPHYVDSVASFDEALFRNCSVVLPWNDDDPETRSGADRLRRLVLTALGRSGPRLILIKSPELFKGAIIKAIGQARKEALSEVFQEAGGDDFANSFATRPVIQGSRDT